MFQNSQITSDLPDIEQLNLVKIHKNYLWILLVNSTLVWSIIFVAFYFFIDKRIVESHPQVSNYGYLLLAVVCAIYFILLIYKRKLIFFCKKIIIF